MFQKRLINWRYLLLPLFLILYQGTALAKDMSVLVSIKPIHSIVMGLMKDVDKPELLIGDQQTPYNFALSTQQQTDMETADLFIWVGPELEASIANRVTQLPASVKVIELLSSNELKILPSRQNPNNRDPFFWMDDRNIMIMLDQLTEVLVEIDPARSHIYVRNRREMLGPLRRIDKEYEYGYRGMKAGLGVQYFDTLRYFEQAYALKTLGQVAASPRDVGDVAGLLNVSARIANNEASCLFVDKSMPAEHLTLLTEGQNVNIGELDTLGVGFAAGPDLYLKLMAYNTDAIKKCINADMVEANEARWAALQNELSMVDGLGGRFILTNHHGQTVTEQDMKGQFSVIYFGYTYCPDVCPTSLMVLTQAFKQMGSDALKVQPYFISVDPERDSVQVMKNYVSYFDSRLIGLTGSKDMIKRVADQFKAKFEKGEEMSSNSENYIMDHTSSLYLMAPDGSFVTKFANGITADALVKELTAIIR